MRKSAEICLSVSPLGKTPPPYCQSCTQSQGDTSGTPSAPAALGNAMVSVGVKASDHRLSPYEPGLNSSHSRLVIVFSTSVHCEASNSLFPVELPTAQGIGEKRADSWQQFSITEV